MRLIDLDKITVDSRVMQAIAQMLTHCKAKHDIQCTAGNCAECIASFFNDPANENLHEIFVVPKRSYKIFNETKGLKMDERCLCQLKTLKQKARENKNGT